MQISKWFSVLSLIGLATPLFADFTSPSHDPANAHDRSRPLESSEDESQSFTFEHTPEDRALVEKVINSAFPVAQMGEQNNSAEF